MNRLFKRCFGFTEYGRDILGLFENFTRPLTYVERVLCFPGVPGNLRGRWGRCKTSRQIGICTSGQILVSMEFCQEFGLLFILSDPSLSCTPLLQRREMIFKTLAVKMASHKYSEGVYIRNRKDL